MAMNVSRRGTLGPGDNGSGDVPRSSAEILPFRPPQIEIEDFDPKPKSSGVTVHIGDDGIIELQIGADEPAADKPGATGFDRNLAEDMDENALMAIASWLIEGVEADLADRREWEETANLAALYLGI